jgi:hypothetical protein
MTPAFLVSTHAISLQGYGRVLPHRMQIVSMNGILLGQKQQPRIHFDALCGVPRKASGRLGEAGYY